MSVDSYARLRDEVILPGFCTHCGTCAGVSRDVLEMVETAAGPIPRLVPGAKSPLNPLAYEACPGRGSHYPTLHEQVFGEQPQNWLLGPFREVFIGYTSHQDVRRHAASGGVITQALCYLLEQGYVDGAVVLEQGQPRPWLARPIIARTPEEVIAASQSVYIPTPVNTILAEMLDFAGRLAYVGLPDQVASLRRLQAAGHAGARKVDYVLGPYVGTAIYLDAIRSYLRANGVASLDEVSELRRREGEWPGYLQVRLQSGRVLRAQKFYYNYLIPFYITRATLYAVDFTNELTDISVGDAWHPRYEAQGAGFSVVVARSSKASNLMHQMVQDGHLVLDSLPPEEALSMHGHMLDFKKRGAFIRLNWRAQRVQPVPQYGYRPATISTSRKVVELFITTLFAVCRTRTARRLVECLPLRIIGPLFNTLRKTWKGVSRPVKRKGLGSVQFVVEPPAGSTSSQDEHVTNGIEVHS